VFLCPKFFDDTSLVLFPRGSKENAKKYTKNIIIASP